MASSSSEDDAVVPGVNRMGGGNLRPKLKFHRPRDVKVKEIVKPSTADDNPSTTLSVQDLSQSLDERRLGPVKGAKPCQVSLKDLCMEDKRRIANLIKELAKVGEEREKAREELEKERREYQVQILKLVEQQEQILKERQDVERHLQECQQLLSQGQQHQHYYNHHHQPPNSPPQQFGLAPSLGQPILPPPALVSPQIPLPFAQPPNAWTSSPDPGPRTYNAGQSMLVNIGSPQNAYHHHHQYHIPGNVEGDIAGQRQQHPSPAVQTMVPTHTYPTLPPGPSFVIPGAYNPPTAPQPVLSLSSAAVTKQPQGQPDSTVHQPLAPTTFFATALQQAEMLDVFSAQKTRGENPPIGLPDAEKEDILQRFLASQAANGNAVATVSPSRKDVGRKKHSGRGSARNVFLPPIMSSTQKSAEIGEHLSVDSHQDYLPLATGKASPGRPGGVGVDDYDEDGDDGREEGNMEKEGRMGAINRVAFAEDADEIADHAPLDDRGDGSNTYRKMTHSERKEQLLRQRLVLLQEQERLKQVLNEQEAMLQEKQKALNKARAHRHPLDSATGEAEDGGMDFGDNDPLGLIPQRLAIDAALERQRAIVQGLELETERRTGTTTTTNNNNNNNNATTTNTAAVVKPKRSSKSSNDNAVAAQSRQDAKMKLGTPPRPEGTGGEREGGPSGRKGGEVRTSKPGQLSDIVCKLDYSLHSDSEVVDEGQGIVGREDDYGEEVEDEGERQPTSGADRKDVGTSVSYGTIPRLYPTTAEQEYAGEENIDLEQEVLSSLQALPSLQPVAPGEKTMSVLEIINSLQSPRGRHGPDARLPLTHHHQTPPPPHTHHHQHPSPFLLVNELRPLHAWRDGDDEDVGSESGDEIVEESDDNRSDNDGDFGNKEDLEESQILEDIFFLK